MSSPVAPTVLIVALLLGAVSGHAQEQAPPQTPTPRGASLYQADPGSPAELVGTVVVMATSATGHPQRLGLEVGDSREPERVWLYDDAKGRELLYRVGREVRVEGLLQRSMGGRTATLRARAYEMRSGNPVVTGAEGEGFRLSFLAGGLDPEGRFLGGTEMKALATFDDRLFAANGYWMETIGENGDPYDGAQVLVLDRRDGRWRLDHEFSDSDEKPGLFGVGFLEEVVFSTDGSGTRLERPVRLLVAGGFGSNTLYVRSTGDGRWVDSRLDEAPWRLGPQPFGPEARYAVGHHDVVTGIDHVFVGVSGGGIRKGELDRSKPGRIRWEGEIELPAQGRIMGLAVCDGVLHASIDRALWRRRDGAAPSWKKVWEDNERNRYFGSAVRRASEVAAPRAGRRSVLFGIEGSRGRMVRIDPWDRDRATVELDAMELFAPARHVLIDYNGVTRIEHPRSGEEVAIFGLEVAKGPEHGGFYHWLTDGVVLWRTPEPRYHVNRIRDPTLPVQPPYVGARQVVVSPFPEDGGQVLYFAGLDTNGNPVHNTAWIALAHVKSVLQEVPVEDLR